MSRWLEAEVVRQHKWAENLYSLFVKADMQPFIAGQFTQIGFYQDDGKVLFRPYSFANSPDDSTLEFYYTLVETGQLTPRLAKLEPGEQLLVAKKGSGRFILSEVPDSETLWLISTGTGLGPYLSILPGTQVWQRFKHIVCVHSVRHKDHLSHQDLFNKFKACHPEQFHYVPIVTRDEVSGAYNDRITNLLKSGQLEKDLGLEITKENSQVMLCGNPDMLHETQALLESRELSLNTFKEKGQITVESYWKA